MSVPEQIPTNQFIIAGGEITGVWTWNLQKESELVVTKQLASTGAVVPLVLGVDYSVNALDLDDDNGGTINFLAPQLPAVAGDVWTLSRNTAIDRSPDFATSGDFLAETINEQLDELTRISQDSSLASSTAVRKDPGVGDTLDPLIPQPVTERALKFRDTGGGNFEMVMSDNDPDQQANAAAASAAAALASEQAAAVSETNAGNSETAAGISETNAGNSETNAGNSETAAALSETNAGNSETAAGNFATAAGVSESNAGISEANAIIAASNAATSETNAGISETNAAASAAQLTGTSTSSLSIGLGAKVFTTQAGKFFDAGSSLLITSDADPNNFMFGIVTTYSGTTLTMDITVTGGSGTFSDWTIRVSGVEGAEGVAVDLSSPTPIGNVTPNTIKATTFEGDAGGTTINEFSTDGTLAGDSDDAVPTEKAVKEYADTKIDDATGVVDQANLKSTTGDLTKTISGSPVLMTGPGGEFGFWPTMAHALSAGSKIIVSPAYSLTATNTGAGNTLNFPNINYNTTLLQRFLLMNGTSSGFNPGTLTVRQRFVQASPPYDIGDGEVHTFIFALIENGSGKIIAMYHAPDPPWANNGPTCIQPEYKKNGKLYRRACIIDKTKDFQDPERYKFVEQEITNEFKNSDMALIPHPFQGNDMSGISIILIDPNDPIVLIAEEMKNGGELALEELFINDYVRFGNEHLNGRRTPDSSVMVVKPNWKNSN